MLDNSFYTISQTPRLAICCRGVGLHSGNECIVHIENNIENTGIVFYSMDNKNNINTIIPANVNFSRHAIFRTQLSNNGYDINTIEHLMAAFRVCRINNVIVKVWGNEIPILDGSAVVWTRLFDSVKYVNSAVPVKQIKILKEIHVEHNKHWCKLHPVDYLDFVIDYEFDHPHPLINYSHRTIEFSTSPRKPVVSLDQQISAAFLLDY